MKYSFIIFFILFGILKSSKTLAQSSSSNLISVIPHNPMHIFYTDINEMRADKIFTRAVEVKFAPDMPVADLYASVALDNYSNTGAPTRISIKLNAQSASNLNSAYTNEILLTKVPIKILSLPKLAGDEKYVLFFDVIQHGCDHFIAPGDYNFSIIFSQSPQ